MSATEKGENSDAGGTEIMQALSPFPLGQRWEVVEVSSRGVT